MFYSQVDQDETTPHNYKSLKAIKFVNSKSAERKTCCKDLCVECV